MNRMKWTSVALAGLASSASWGCAVAGPDAGDEIESISQPIHHGERSYWQSVVAVRTSKGSCTGTAISERVVLTAAHCFNKFTFSSDHKLNISMTFRFADNSFRTVPATVHRFPGYDPDKVPGDMALVRVQGAMFTPAAIWDDKVYTGMNLDIYGYGQRGGDRDDPGEQNVGNDYAQVSLTKVENRWFKAKGWKARICHGDSGGPVSRTVTVNGVTTPTVVGVASEMIVANKNDECTMWGWAQKWARPSANMSWFTDFDFLECQRVATNKGNVQVCKDTLPRASAQIGTFRNVGGSGQWYLDADGSRSWTGGDRVADFASGTDIPLVTSKCSGSSKNAVRLSAVRKEGAGLSWFYTNDGLSWDGKGGFQFGAASDLPFFHSSYPAAFRDGDWFIETSGDHIWGSDWLVQGFGFAGSQPVSGKLGDQNMTVIGSFFEGNWYIDANNNGLWDGGDDVWYFGQAGDIPVVGDFTGDDAEEIGVFRQGQWIIDYNGNHQWDGTGAGKDAVWNFGASSDTPVVARNGWYFECSP